MVATPRTLTGAAMAALVLAVTASRAQTVLDLPRPSQAASVTQRVGITDVAIRYSRPLVKGRKVWGSLVPYDQVWRAGANENTTFSVSDPVTIEGKPLPAGTYGLHMIPREKDWTVIFSKTANAWGSFTYDQAEDALRVTVQPQATELREALTYDLDDVLPDSVVVRLRWEKIAVRFKVAVDTTAVTARSLDAQLRGWSRWMWQPWDEAATYLVENHGDLKTALEDSAHSIRIEERFDNVMTRSSVLKAQGNAADADAARKRALTLATQQQIHNYGMGLLGEGRRDEALEMFQLASDTHPGTMLSAIELARLASARGDFEEAKRQIQSAIAMAPEGSRTNLENLLHRLERKEDITR